MAMSKWLAVAAFLAAVNLSGCTGDNKRPNTNNPAPNSMQRPGAPTAMGTNGVPPNGFGSTGAPVNSMNSMNSNPNFRPMSNGPGTFGSAPMTGAGPAAFPTGGMDPNLVRTTAPNAFPTNPAFPANTTPFPSSTGPGFPPTTGMSGGGVPAPIPPGYGAPAYNPGSSPFPR
jgi:hypothetical protein